MGIIPGIVSINTVLCQCNVQLSNNGLPLLITIAASVTQEELASLLFVNSFKSLL